MTFFAYKSSSHAHWAWRLCSDINALKSEILIMPIICPDPNFLLNKSEGFYIDQRLNIYYSVCMKNNNVSDSLSVVKTRFIA